MNTIEKFYSDAIKTANSKDEEFDAELTRIFCRAISLQDKRLTGLADDFADYWISRYGIASGSGEFTQEESVEWFYKIFAFLTDQFEEDMDFSQEDWEQINLIVSASSGDLNLEILNSLMMIIVERKKL